MSGTLTTPDGTGERVKVADRIPCRTVTRDDLEWDGARLAWNRAVDQRPALVTYPETAADVRAVITVARDSGLRVALQGTGHHAGALGDLRRTVLLRTDRMREITVDPAAGRVRAGAGATWGALALRAFDPERLAVAAFRVRDETPYVSGSGSDAGAGGFELTGAAAAATLVEGVSATHRLINHYQAA
jgi:FAD/FMN-containing dehydrogenase